jgi:hypothetical protein
MLHEREHLVEVWIRAVEEDEAGVGKCSEEIAKSGSG